MTLILSPFQRCFTQYSAVYNILCWVGYVNDLKFYLTLLNFIKKKLFIAYNDEEYRHINHLTMSVVYIGPMLWLYNNLYNIIYYTYEYNSPYAICHELVNIIFSSMKNIRQQYIL